MKSTEFTDLKSALVEPDKVKKLTLIACRKFPDKILDFKNLETLLFQCSSLKEIPKEVSQLKKLKFLSFSGSKIAKF